jgi:hypothetical protein
MLVPPASSVGDFVRDISLFRLIEIIEMPRQISHGTESGDEQEESNLGGLARDKTREKILDLFQNLLPAREHGLRKRDRRRNEGVISTLVPVCCSLGVSFVSCAQRPLRSLLSISG